MSSTLHVCTLDKKEPLHVVDISRSWRRSRALRITLTALGGAVLMGIAVLIFQWTAAIRRQSADEQLRVALSKVLETSGERGLLEMAGVPVNDIFYGDSGVTLFQGGEASWNYSADELQNIAVYEKVNQSVVHITTIIGNPDDFLNMVPTQGTGSGVILSKNGYILTNTHVIEDAASLSVRLHDGTSVSAHLVGMDQENDLAVIKIEPTEAMSLTPIVFGSSASVKVGQKVIAIGNPFGYDRTMTIGTISGLGRPVTDGRGQVIMGMLQTDAAINPGNSGGPLLNSKGEMIGINTSMYSAGSGAQGISFAIPVDTAVSAIPELITTGKVTRGWIDIVPVQLNQSIASYAKLDVSSGILISQVTARGKAEKAGLKGGTERVRYGDTVIYLGGDVLTKINDVDIATFEDMYSALMQTKPRDEVTVTVDRKGERKVLTVELVERTAENVALIVR